MSANTPAGGLLHHAHHHERPEGAPLLRVTDLKKAYGAIQAVGGVSFEVKVGEIFGVIGPNGSGKSTLLSAIAGLVPPTAGAIYAETEPTLLGVNAAMISELSGERNVILLSKLPVRWKTSTQSGLPA